MKHIHWIIQNKISGDWVQYQSNIGPVDARHVETSPSVMRWADGEPIEVIPESEFNKN